MAQLAYADADAPAGDAPGVIRLEFTGRAAELVPIVAKNAALTVLTLGVYRFWAKTRVRRYLWSQVRLLGDPLEYSGTGGELFRGFLVALFLVVLPLGAYNVACNLLIDAERLDLRLAALGPLYAAILFLVGVATHRARRYRFSRTSWRGVRFTQQGSSARYGLMYFGSVLLDVVTLGWSYPWTNLRLRSALANDAGFGDRRFAFAGGAGPLYQHFVAVWLIALLGGLLVWGLVFLTAANLVQAEIFTPDELESMDVAVGLCMMAAIGALTWLAMAWYSAREAAYFADCTRYQGLQARFDVSAGALIQLRLGNLLIWIATLGLGGAFVELRNLRFACARLSFAGNMEPAAIGQSLAPAPRRGEGLAEVFDLGAT